MSGLHWFPFYWDDYSTKTMHLTQAQHGAYILMLRWIYTTGKPVPDKQKYSIAQARLKPELEAVDAVLDWFFQENSGFWHNLRADEVMAEAAEKHRINSEKGQKGGLKRASNAQARLEPELNAGSSNYNYNHSEKEESKKVEDTSSLRSDVPAKSVRKSKRSLPEVFPLQENFEWAKGHWLQKGRFDLCESMDEEAGKFRDFHTARGSTSADWSASWRTWAQNAIKFNNGGHNGRSQPRKSAHQKFIEGALLAINEPEAGMAGIGRGYLDETGPALLETGFRAKPD